MDFQDVGNAGIVELPKVLGVGVTGKRSSGFAQGFCLVEAVRVDEAHAFSGHVVGVLPLLLGGIFAVVAVGVGHAHALREAARAGVVISLQARARVAEAIVELRAQLVIDQTHAGIPVTAVSGRCTKVFAEDHGIVAGNLVLENGVALIGVTKSTGAVELPLDAAEIAGLAGVLVGPGHLAEKVVGHVLDGVEAEAVGFGTVELPAGGPNQITADILGEG